MKKPAVTRTLVIVLGDQLDLNAAAFDGFDAAEDMVWMAEADEESTHVWSTKPRIAIFLSAMRHFAETVRAAPASQFATRGSTMRATAADWLRYLPVI